MQYKEIFKVPEYLNQDNAENERKFKEYVERYMPELKYKGYNQSYAATQYELTITDPSSASTYKKPFFTDALNVIFNVNGCISTLNGSTLIITVPNKNKGTLTLYNGIEELEKVKKEKDELLCYIGEYTNSKPILFDFRNDSTPHLLIAGQTRSGKSVCLNTILLSLMGRYTEKELQIVIIDLKKAGMYWYQECPHVRNLYLEPLDALAGVTKLIEEMKERNEFTNNQGYTNVHEFNTAVAPSERLPYILVVVEESDELLKARGKGSSIEIREAISTIAHMGGSSGLHLILASQKPVSKNLDTSIKSNIPSSIAFRVRDRQDSMSIIGSKEAVSLRGSGDCFVKFIDSIDRGQVAYASNKEVKDAIEWIKSRR